MTNVFLHKTIYAKNTTAHINGWQGYGDLASLKAKVYKIDEGQLKTLPVDFGKLSNVVNNEVAKKICMIN